MKRGDIVEWLDPLTEDETTEAFRVVELRGDRVLVEDIHSHYNIRPTFAYEVADLKVRWKSE
jgi:hypothetical protein